MTTSELAEKLGEGNGHLNHTTASFLPQVSQQPPGGLLQSSGVIICVAEGGSYSGQKTQPPEPDHPGGNPRSLVCNLGQIMHPQSSVCSSMKWESNSTFFLRAATRTK